MLPSLSLLRDNLQYKEESFEFCSPDEVVLAFYWLKWVRGTPSDLTTTWRKRRRVTVTQVQICSPIQRKSTCFKPVYLNHTHGTSYGLVKHKYKLSLRSFAEHFRNHFFLPRSVATCERWFVNFSSLPHFVRKRGWTNTSKFESVARHTPFLCCQIFFFSLSFQYTSPFHKDIGREQWVFARGRFSTNFCKRRNSIGRSGDEKGLWLEETRL